MVESVGSILLGFELLVVFLCGLALFGLKTLPAPVALGGMVVALALMIVGVIVLRWEWGGWYCFAFQVLLTLAGFVHPSLFFVGGVFLASWIYLFITARRIDAERAPVLEAYRREQAARAAGNEEVRG